MDMKGEKNINIFIRFGLFYLYFKVNLKFGTADDVNQ